MKFAYVENNTIKQVFSDLPEQWNNISGLHHAVNDLAFLKSIGFLPVRQIVPVFDPGTQKVGDPKWEIVNDEVVESYDIYGVSEIEISQRKVDFMNRLRENRNSLLSQSDWALVSDVVESKGAEWVDAWKKYRQELRDFPSTINIENDPNPNLNSLAWPRVPYVSNK